jgi:hypothetical protein
VLGSLEPGRRSRFSLQQRKELLGAVELDEGGLQVEEPERWAATRPRLASTPPLQRLVQEGLAIRRVTGPDERSTVERQRVPQHLGALGDTIELEEARGFFERATPVASSEPNENAQDASAPGKERVRLLPLEQRLEEPDGIVPMPRQVSVLDEPCRRQGQPVAISEALRHRLDFRDELGAAPKVAHLGERHTEVPPSIHRVAVEPRGVGDLDTPLQLGDAARVAEPGACDSSGLQGVHARLLSARSLGHRDRFGADPDRLFVPPVHV